MDSREAGFFGRLRAAYLSSGKTVREISKASGVNKLTIDNWLGTEPTMPRALALAMVGKVLGVTVEYLVSGDEGIAANNEELQYFQKARRWRKVVERLDSLDPELAEKVTSLILAVPLSPMLGESLPRAEGE